MRVCTCSHTEIVHYSKGCCAECNCCHFQPANEKSLVQRVAELENQVTRLTSFNECTCTHGATQHSANGGCFATSACRCKATSQVAKEKSQSCSSTNIPNPPSKWLTLGYHDVCERHSRAHYGEYYLKCEVDAYLQYILQYIGVLKG